MDRVRLIRQIGEGWAEGAPARLPGPGGGPWSGRGLDPSGLPG